MFELGELESFAMLWGFLSLFKEVSQNGTLVSSKLILKFIGLHELC